MTPSKSYFHDRLVLLLVTISAFLTILGSVLVMLRFDAGRNEGYIVQYRSNLGISAIKLGHGYELLAFILFMVITTTINIVLSKRIYPIHRQFAITVLSLGILLLVLAIIVSNALLILS